MHCQGLDWEHAEWIIYHVERVSLSTGVRKKTALWTEMVLKAESFLGSGSIWCWKTSGGWGLYVRTHTQPERRNARLSSHGFPFPVWKDEKLYRCIFDLGEASGCPAWRRQTGVKVQTFRLCVVLVAWLQCKGLVRRDGLLAYERKTWCCKGCLLFNCYGRWVQVCCYGHRDDYYRVFSCFLFG